MKKLLWTLPLAAMLGGVLALQTSPLLAQQKQPSSGQKGFGKGTVDADGAFRLLDTNRDGKVDKAEFARIVDISPRMRDQRDKVDAIFEALDKNGDGVLTLDEYRGIIALQLVARRQAEEQGIKTTSAKSPIAAVQNERPLTADETKFFEQKIRPVLAEKCYKCHSAEAGKTKGGLALDTRVGARKGGDTGPAVVPGDMRKSVLLDAIHYTNKELQMPPEKEGGKLSASIIADFETWVKMGAPDPRDGAAISAKKEWDYDKAKQHWAYQPPKKSSPPTVKNSSWPRTDIDRFILGGLEMKSLAPVADADRLTLVRRVYFDLIGLPPSFDEITTFLDDKSPEAFTKVVDKLLSAPQFGERWGRHWLDVARYAESSGKDVNVAYPHAWRYRDYVIASFNADKPYDLFVREQIAGDLLPSANDRQKAEQLIASGFLALGTKSVNEQNPRQFYLDVADEQIDTVSQAILGTTVACARCHDHKFDPITQHEYYALAGIFTSTDTRYGTTSGVQNRHAADLVELPKNSGEPTLGRSMSTEELQRQQKKLAGLRDQQREMFMEFAKEKAGKADAKSQSPQRQFDRLRILNETGLLAADLNLYDENGIERPLAMGVRDLPTSRLDAFGGTVRRLGQGRLNVRPPEFSAIGDAALYTRGDVDKPAEKVPRAFPVALTHSTPPNIPKGASGRRELADWLTDSNNPLTARVYANRVWGWLFGQGIVSSPDNFGNMGSRPSNQPLLDTLAMKLIENGWSTKKLIREIVLSHAYQLSTAYDERAHDADPENALAWRMSPRRLDAECIRDAMLAVSGDLDLKPALGSVVARVGDRPIGGPRFFGLGESQVNTEERFRSVYLPVVRDLVPDALALFDFPEPSLVSGTRETTSVPSQALYMLNSDFVRHQAQGFADRVLRWRPSAGAKAADVQFKERVDVAYWLVFTRPPSDNETRAANDFFAKFAGINGGGSAGAVSQTKVSPIAWTSFCRALLASAEFRYLN
ncbi:MAG: DUF1549 domain-containing protein [Verrucomicrobia bacterium]|nr:DUF1549 domain-containing protein [Verrucomicrobiota bacterium]